MSTFELCRVRAAIIAFAAVVFISPVAAQEPFPDFGRRFTQYTGNPLLTLESINPWDLEPGKAIPGTVHPDVLYFPEGKDNYKFWMIFTPLDGFKDESPPPPWANIVAYWERLTLVRSNDGINWDKTGININPVISPPPNCGVGVPEWDSGVHYDPDLVYVPAKEPNIPEKWFLYFAVQNLCGGPNSIGLAISSNGILYEKYGPVMLSVTNLATPSVVYDPQANNGQGMFYAWYLYGTTPGASLGFATSPDGINWTPAWTPSCGPGTEPCWENGALKPDETFCEKGVSHPDVIKKGNEFWMYYQAEPFRPVLPPLPPLPPLYHDFMIRRARSTDGINWTKDERPILEKYNSETEACTTTNEVPDHWVFWDRTGPATAPTPVTMFYRPSAVVVGDAMYLYFGGLNKPCYDCPSSHPYDRDIGLAFSSRFNDVPPIHWAYEPIEAVAKADISSGCGNNNFCPEAGAKRREAAAFIAEGAGMDPIFPEYDHYFCDVANDGFAANINAIYEAGITAGCGNCDPPDTKLRFCPENTMNRLQLGLFFYEALDLLPSNGNQFNDVPELYKPMIESLYDAEIVAGCAPNRYCPDDVATRAMLAAMTTAAFLGTLDRPDEVTTSSASLHNAPLDLRQPTAVATQACEVLRAEDGPQLDWIRRLSELGGLFPRTSRP